MNSIIDLDQAFIAAQAQAQDWEEKFTQDFYAPEILQEQTMAFLSMSDEERAVLSEAEPELFEKIIRNVNQLARRVMRPGGTHAPST